MLCCNQQWFSVTILRCNLKLDYVVIALLKSWIRVIQMLNAYVEIAGVWHVPSNAVNELIATTKSTFFMDSLHFVNHTGHARTCRFGRLEHETVPGKEKNGAWKQNKKWIRSTLWCSQNWYKCNSPYEKGVYIRVQLKCTCTQELANRTVPECYIDAKTNAHKKNLGEKLLVPLLPVVNLIHWQLEAYANDSSAQVCRHKIVKYTEYRSLFHNISSKHRCSSLYNVSWNSFTKFTLYRKEKNNHIHKTKIRIFFIKNVVPSCRVSFDVPLLMDYLRFCVPKTASTTGL